MGFLHGIRTEEKLGGPVPIQGTDNDVIGLVGTSSKGKPLSVIKSRRDIVEMFGKVDKSDGMTIPRSLYHIFDQTGAVVVVARVEQAAASTAGAAFVFSTVSKVSSSAEMTVKVAKTGVIEFEAGGNITAFGQKIVVKQGGARAIPEKTRLVLPSGTTMGLPSGASLKLPSDGYEIIVSPADDGEGAEPVVVNPELADDGLWLVPTDDVFYSIRTTEEVETVAVSAFELDLWQDTQVFLKSGSSLEVKPTDVFIMESENSFFAVSKDFEINLPEDSTCFVSSGAELKPSGDTYTVLVPAGAKYKKGQTEATYADESQITMEGGGGVFTSPVSGASQAGGETEAVLEGIESLKRAKNELGFKPSIVIAPWFSHKKVVADRMISVCKKLRGSCFADCKGSKEEAREYRELFSSSRINPLYPQVDLGESLGVVPLSVSAAGLAVRTSREEGFWVSPSGKVIYGVEKLTDSISWDISDPDSDANILNNQHISTVIREGGFRYWGLRTAASPSRGENPDSDIPNFYFNVRRTSDAIMDAIVEAHFWALDRNITRAYVSLVTESVNTYLRDLVAKGALTYGKINFPEDLNSLAAIKSGKVTFEIRYTPSYPAEEITFIFKIVDDGTQTLFEEG